MAKFTPMELLSGLHGKVCMHSDVSFAERYGTMFTMKRCKVRTTPATENELGNRNKFKAVRTAIANLTAEQTAAYKEAFRKQTKYKSLQGYIFAQEYAKIN